MRDNFDIFKDQFDIFIDQNDNKTIKTNFDKKKPSLPPPRSLSLAPSLSMSLLYMKKVIRCGKINFMYHFIIFCIFAIQNFLETDMLYYSFLFYIIKFTIISYITNNDKYLQTYPESKNKKTINQISNHLESSPIKHLYNHLTLYS